MKLMYDELDVVHRSVAQEDLALMLGLLVHQRGAHFMAEPYPFDNWRITVSYEHMSWLDKVIKQYRFVPNEEEEDNC